MNDGTINPSRDARRRELMQMAVNSWGTGVILESRTRRYQSLLNASSLLGFILPVVVGATTMTFGAKWASLEDMVYIVGILAGIQALISAILIFFRFDDRLRVAQDSSSLNKALAPRCDALAKNVALPEEVFSVSHAALMAECRSQELFDEKLGFSEKERRMGGRSGLRRFSLKCGVCGITPLSDNAKIDGSKCKSCGDF